MQWEFTPEQVVKGQADYGIREFRADLFREVQGNVQGWLDGAGALACFDVIYDYTYWLATGRSEQDFVLLPDAPVEREFLSAIRPSMEPNVAMLGAILQRMIMDGVAQGLAIDEAVAAAARRHGAAAGPSLAATGVAPCAE